MNKAYSRCLVIACLAASLFAPISAFAQFSFSIYQFDYFGEPLQATVGFWKDESSGLTRISPIVISRYETVPTNAKPQEGVDPRFIGTAEIHPDVALLFSSETKGFFVRMPDKKLVQLSGEGVYVFDRASGVLKFVEPLYSPEMMLFKKEKQIVDVLHQFVRESREETDANQRPQGTPVKEHSSSTEPEARRP